MSTCPHCKAVANPFRFFAYSRWSPYSCPKCSKRSEFATLGLVCAAITGVIISSAAEAVLHLPLLGTICVGIVVILGMMNLLKLRPKGMDSEQLAGQVSSEAAPSAPPDEPSA